MKPVQLSGRDLRLQIGPRVLCDCLNIYLNAGELTGLTGEPGSGKTTLLQVLAGFMKLERGEVTLNGKVSVPWKEAVVATVPQSMPTVPMLSVAETVALPLQALKCPREEIAERTNAALDQLGLGGLATQLVSTVSGGQRQRTIIAQALARRPEILLADEPTSCLDFHWRGVSIGLLEQCARDGAIVLLTSNEPDTVAACTRTVRLG